MHHPGHRFGRKTLSIMLLLGALAPGIRAATLTVTSTGDSGAGTLRDVLEHAADGDTINFAPPTAATIHLASGSLAVGANVSINGPGVRPSAIARTF